MPSIQNPSTVVDNSPIPMPGIYKEQQALAQKAYATSLSDINQRRQAMLSQYGMTGTVDPQGAYSNYRIDPANQFGQLQMMKQSQGIALNDAWDQSAERGLGNSGLAAQGESLLRYGQGADSAQLGQDFVAGMSGLAQENLKNQDTLAQANYQALANARNEAIQNQMFTSTSAANAAAARAAGGGASHMQIAPDSEALLAKYGYSGEEISNDVWAIIGSRGWGQYQGPGGIEDPQVMQNGQLFNSDGVTPWDGSGPRYIWVKVGTPQGTSTEMIELPPPVSQTQPQTQTQPQQQPQAPPIPTTAPASVTNPTQRANLAAAISGVLRSGGMN